VLIVETLAAAAMAFTLHLQGVSLLKRPITERAGSGTT
jgi:PST family polysaccharide transporter